MPIQQLRDRQTLTDSFTAVSSYGTSVELVTVTCHGANDAPVLFPTRRSSDLEDNGADGDAGGNLTTGGLLTIADVDQGQSNFSAQAGTAGSNGYGTFKIGRAHD